MTDTWTGCYRHGWTRTDLVPEAFAHPAKMAKGLAFRIVEHCVSEGWLLDGQWVIDPFGGVSTVALPLLIRGVNVVTCELEETFRSTALANLARWETRYKGRLPKWGTARLLCGDSRRGFSDIYGTTPGQLAQMPPGAFDAVCSSPPYEGSVSSASHGIDWSKAGPATGNRRRGAGSQHEETLRAQLAYSDASDNLGNSHGDTFWAASREIVSQCYQILKPGGHAVWVVKDYVRGGKRVPFCAQWQALCESVGFRTLHVHRAMLTEEFGTQVDTEGNHHTERTERKSFFRRLAERKGSPRIDWETVVCQERPGERAGRLP